MFAGIAILVQSQKAYFWTRRRGPTGDYDATAGPSTSTPQSLEWSPAR